MHERECSICGSPRMKANSKGYFYCMDCNNAAQRRRRQERDDCLEKTRMQPAMTLGEVRDEMARRGYPMSKERVRQLEKQALYKLQQLWKHDWGECAPSTNSRTISEPVTLKGIENATGRVYPR